MSGPHGITDPSIILSKGILECLVGITGGESVSGHGAPDHAYNSMIASMAASRGGPGGH